MNAERDTAGRWPRQFTELVVSCLPELDDDAELTADLPLIEAGLDSFGLVRLMAELEDRFGFAFAESDMTPETFHSAGSLWSAVSRHLPDNGSGGGATGRGGGAGS